MEPAKKRSSSVRSLKALRRDADRSAETAYWRSLALRDHGKGVAVQLLNGDAHSNAPRSFERFSFPLQSSLTSFSIYSCLPTDVALWMKATKHSPDKFDWPRFNTIPGRPMMPIWLLMHGQFLSHSSFDASWRVPSQSCSSNAVPARELVGREYDACDTLTLPLLRTTRIKFFFYMKKNDGRPGLRQWKWNIFIR